ncbi:TraB/GumN family protein [Cecembia calidifontis]|jgi:uncharacterized protein YbaP (TraB family)|uniref:TraB family protein n=1 Tax=Cecembia calidifontis TaxID=1187080 RepID=A0A4V2F6S1_9BACT|nr:TraB/GumN family protein [Cecembia calidifontis]RZS97299.1 hypothetical protein BC751_2905 [Cecembia calidifontis]
MKNQFRLLIYFQLFLFLPFFLCAQGSEEKSLLWKISGNGLEKESYLFGTIHLICEDQFKMDERILKALSKSKKIALEIDLTDPNVMMDMQRLSVNKDFANIKDEFDPEHQIAVDAFLKESFGVGLEQMGIMKPFVISSMIMTKMMPCEQISGYEMFFIQKAQEEKIPVVGLETVASQIGIFDQIPIKEQLDDIGKLVTNNEGMEELTAMVKAYLEEDIEQLYQMIASSELFKEYKGIFLDDRNKSWIPIIEDLVKEQPTFIAVGSGHLASETGVIQLLRNTGYTIEPIK